MADCNTPPQQPCGPGPFDSPICYTVPPSLTILNGFQRTTLNPDCSAASVEILDGTFTPVAGAVVAACDPLAPDGCCDPASICAILQGLGTQVPGVTDTALFVTVGGCFLGVPGGGGGGFPGYGVPVTTACANAAGVSALAARADHVHRSAVPVQDEGVSTGTARCSINFIGAGVTAVDNAGLDRVDITIPGPVFPLLAPDGTCAAPSYSFTSSPDSGMFYTGTAVRISDDNCTDFIEIGASINIVSSASAIMASAGTSFDASSATAMTLAGGSSFTATAATTMTLTATGAVNATAGTTFNIASTGGNTTVDAGTNFLLTTGGVLRLTVQSGGAWSVAGSVGAATEVLTSNGAGTPPTWTTAPTSFPGFATPTVAADAAAATGGVATTAIRSDAKLQVSTGTPVTATGTTNSAGVATTLARSDHLHRLGLEVLDAGALVATRPRINFIDGTGISVVVTDNGGSDRADITITNSSGVTGFATPTVAADAAAATGGAATTAIRSDAKLQVSTGTPVATGTANAAGTASTLARSDHVHLTSFTGMVFSRGATVLTPTAAINVIVWRAPFSCTVTNVRGYRVGGTGATINARRNGTDNHLGSALSVSSADTWMDGGAVSNTAYAAGDRLEIMLVTVTGSPTQVAIQVDYTRT